MRIRTLRTVVIGFAALGFSLFTVPVLGSLYMEDHFGLNAFERGVVTAIGGFVGLLILPWLGRRLDRSYRRRSEPSLRMIGAFIVPQSCRRQFLCQAGVVHRHGSDAKPARGRRLQHGHADHPAHLALPPAA